MHCSCAVRRYHATEPFPSLNDRHDGATSVMYNGNTLPAKTHATQPTLAVPAQPTNGWIIENATQGSHASQRHTMMFLDPRPPRTDTPNTRPLSMTAVSGFSNLGFQNPQGEYLPQPHMPPPIVQPPKLSQATAVQSEPSFRKSCPIAR